MPELPDVEVYKCYFDSTALHQPIEGVAISDKALLENTSPASVRESLCGASFEATRRRGKHLFARPSTDRWLDLHFGMSGELLYYNRAEKTPDYEYFRIDFVNGYHLSLVMPRKLGHVRLRPSGYCSQREGTRPRCP